MKSFEGYRPNEIYPIVVGNIYSRKTTWGKKVHAARYSVQPRPIGFTRPIGFMRIMCSLGATYYRVSACKQVLHAAEGDICKKCLNINTPEVKKMSSNLGISKTSEPNEADVSSVTMETEEKSPELASYHLVVLENGQLYVNSYTYEGLQTMLNSPQSLHLAKKLVEGDGVHLFVGKWSAPNITFKKVVDRIDLTREKNHYVNVG
jgi:hypothetical protein